MKTKLMEILAAVANGRELELMVKAQVDCQLHDTDPSAFWEKVCSAKLGLHLEHLCIKGPHISCRICIKGLYWKRFEIEERILKQTNKQTNIPQAKQDKKNG